MAGRGPRGPPRIAGCTTALSRSETASPAACPWPSAKRSARGARSARPSWCATHPTPTPTAISSRTSSSTSARRLGHATTCGSSRRPAPRASLARSGTPTPTPIATPGQGPTSPSRARTCYPTASTSGIARRSAASRPAARRSCGKTCKRPRARTAACARTRIRASAKPPPASTSGSWRTSCPRMSIATPWARNPGALSLARVASRPPAAWPSAPPTSIP
mmetsp:Transcript_111497/g.320312  ORF Transcript_111497/g.320312 Transcript_111497/m.320312 type:complete len:220 (-) Transcript_111497:3062-3721(-)